MKNNTTMLQDLIIAAKCRKGKAEAITEKGAYWLPLPAIRIRSFGGDGIGQSSTDCINYLELRHYRDGTVKVMVNFHTWHQNHGSSDAYISAPVLKCQTTEEVIIELKKIGLKESDYGQPHVTAAYSDWGQDTLTAALTTLGLPEYELPSPDDEPAPAPSPAI